MLSVRLPVNGRLLVVKFGDNQKSCMDFLLYRGQCLSPHIVQESTVCIYIYLYLHLQNVYTEFLSTHRCTLSSNCSVRTGLCFTYFEPTTGLYPEDLIHLNWITRERILQLPVQQRGCINEWYMGTWSFPCPDRMAPRWVENPSSPVKSDRHPIVSSTLQHCWGLSTAVSATQVGTWRYLIQRLIIGCLVLFFNCFPCGCLSTPTRFKTTSVDCVSAYCVPGAFT